MKKLFLTIIAILSWSYSNAALWDEFPSLRTQHTTAEVYVKCGDTYKYFLISKNKYINLSNLNNSSSWQNLTSNYSWSATRDIVTPFSIDSNNDSKVDIVYYFGRIGMHNEYINEVSKVSFTCSTTSTSLSANYAHQGTTAFNSYFQLENTIYAMRNGQLFKRSVSSFLAITNHLSSTGWSLVTNPSSPILSNFFNKQGKLSVAVGGSNSGIYSLNGISWVKTAPLHSDISSGTNWKVVKYRHLPDIIFYSIDGSQSYILEEYSTDTTLVASAWVSIESRYSGDDFRTKQVFCDDYVYYGIDNSRLVRLKLPKPKFDLLSTSSNNLMYEQDGFHFLPIGINPLRLKGYNLGIDNNNYFIGIATASTSNDWDNTANPAWEQWIISATEVNQINNGIFNLRAWMMSKGIPTTSGSKYKLTIAVGNPWTSKPAIIKF